MEEGETKPKKSTLFVLLLVVGASAIFFAYAALGPVAPRPVQKAHSLFSHTLTKLAEALNPEGDGSRETRNLTSDYETESEEEDPEPFAYAAKRTTQRDAKTITTASSAHAYAFPPRAVPELNASIAYIMDLLEPFYKEIEDTMRSVSSNPKPWGTMRQGYKVANGYKETFFDTLSKYSVNTIHLKVKNSALRRIFDHSFYNYTSNDCQKTEATSIYGDEAGGRLYNASCQSDFTASLKPRPFQRHALGVGLPENAGTQQLDDVTRVTFVHVVQNAIVRSAGDIYVDGAGLKIVPQRCSQDLTGKPINKVPTHTYPELFTIAQFWGSGFFHATVEELPRLAPYVAFLRRHPTLPVHVESKTGFLAAIFRHLGLDPNRIVSGNVKAVTLLAPAGSACGRPGLFTAHLMSLWYRAGIRSAPEARDTIVVVRRSPGRRRWFQHHDAILKMVKKLATERGLRVEVFSDNPVPPLHDALRMFSRAWMVIGPHGAGLSNMFFTEPGTVVLEGLCYNKGKANLCYRNLAQALGLRWYGVLLSEQCMQIRPEHLEKPLRFYLDAFFPTEHGEQRR